MSQSPAAEPLIYKAQHIWEIRAPKLVAGSSMVHRLRKGARCVGFWLDTAQPRAQLLYLVIAESFSPFNLVPSSSDYSTKDWVFEILDPAHRLGFVKGPISQPNYI
jgi:hypothetical protein